MGFISQEKGMSVWEGYVSGLPSLNRIFLANGNSPNNNDNH